MPTRARGYGTGDDVGSAAATRARQTLPPAYLRWFAPYQFADGKVPCCVDARGADPWLRTTATANSSFCGDELRRYTPTPRSSVMWPHVVAAMRISKHCANRAPRAISFRAPRFYGLLPASISHEGYSSQADALVLGRFLGTARLRRRHRSRARAGRLADAWRWAARARRISARPAGLAAGSAWRAHDIAYDRGRGARRLRSDIDRHCASLRGFPYCVPPCPVRATYERYWLDSSPGATGARWDEYTPYELRIVGTFVRLGWRERAQELFAYFHCRPPSARLEPVGRGRGTRLSRAALHRRHAAWLGRFRFHSCSARPVRVRARRRSCAGSRTRHSIGWLDGRRRCGARFAHALRQPDLFAARRTLDGRSCGWMRRPACRPEASCSSRPTASSRSPRRSTAGLCHGRPASCASPNYRQRWWSTSRGDSLCMVYRQWPRASNSHPIFSGVAPRRPTRSRARPWPTGQGRASGIASATRRGWFAMAIRATWLATTTGAIATTSR